MDKQTFIQQYVTTFIASWTAKNYDRACADGEHSRLSNPPIEDAIYLAEEAWHKTQDFEVLKWKDLQKN